MSKGLITLERFCRRTEEWGERIGSHSHLNVRLPMLQIFFREEGLWMWWQEGEPTIVVPAPIMIGNLADLIAVVVSAIATGRDKHMITMRDVEANKDTNGK